MKLSRHFAHYRETGHDRPWFAVGPVLNYRITPNPSGARVANIKAGVYLTVGSHTFAIHRSVT